MFGLSIFMMIKLILGLPLLLLCLIAIAGCSQTIDISSDPIEQSSNLKNIKLNLTTDSWTSWVPPEEAHKISSSILEVSGNEEFGPNIHSNVPFKVLEII